MKVPANYVSPDVIDQRTGRPTVTAIYPVFDAAGQSVGQLPMQVFMLDGVDVECGTTGATGWFGLGPRPSCGILSPAAQAALTELQDALNAWLRANGQAAIRVTPVLDNATVLALESVWNHIDDALGVNFTLSSMVPSTNNIAQHMVPLASFVRATTASMGAQRAVATTKSPTTSVQALATLRPTVPVTTATNATRKVLIVGTVLALTAIVGALVYRAHRS